MWMVFEMISHNNEWLLTWSTTSTQQRWIIFKKTCQDDDGNSLATCCSNWTSNVSLNIEKDLLMIIVNADIDQKRLDRLRVCWFSRYLSVRQSFIYLFILLTNGFHVYSVFLFFTNTQAFWHSIDVCVLVFFILLEKTH
jgi:hypothetical protein